MASGFETDESNLVGESFFLSSLLNAMGYSKLEVNIRQSKWEFLEQKENIFFKNNELEEGCVTSGSSSEGMSGGPYYGGELSDYDCIRVLRNFRVVDSTEDVGDALEHNDKNTVILKEIPDENFPGYVKLLVVKADTSFLEILPVVNGQRFLSNNIITDARKQQEELSKVITSKNPLAKYHTSTNTEKHGPAVSFQVSEPESTLAFLSELISNTGNQDKDQGIHGHSRPLSACDIDMVSCIRRNKWPALATRWVTRYRSGKWPEQSKIQSITKHFPTYLAPVGHKCSPDMNLQWRLSFNVVEKSLIRSFNEAQISCYALLKFFLKDYIKGVATNVLSSYCAKTTVFWISESEGADTMATGNLLHYFVKCLQFIRRCLLDGKMPVYFTGSGNAFPTDMTSEDSAKIVLELGKAIQDPLTPLQKCKSFFYPMQVSKENAENFPKLTVHSILIAWLEMRCGILESIHGCGTKDMLWVEYVAEPVEENIRRYKDMMDEAMKLIYCQPLVQMLQSCLGFLCYSKVSSDDTKTETDCVLLREAEELLCRSQNGDITMCPLRLATFYIKQNRPNAALRTIDAIISKAELIGDRQSFMEMLYKRMYEHISVVVNIDNMQVLHTFLELITANYNLKLHEEEVLYMRNNCKEALDFLDCPLAAQRSMSFDATFMLPEAPALPSALKLELYFSRLFEVKGECRGMKLSPILCAYFLRFLAFHMQGNLCMCKETLCLFQCAVQKEQKFYQARGYNLLARCFAMIDQSQKAAKCLLSSLRIDPSWNNVAFGYLMLVYNVWFRN